MRKSRGALQETLNAHSAIKVANDQGFDEFQEDFADIDESAIAIIKTKRTIQFRPLTWQRG